eukprot:471597_1
MVHENNTASYYSFGAQYRYNLEQHPFYVKNKYDNLKTELLTYFFTKYSSQDQMQLLQSQTEKIKAMKSNLQPILKQLIKIPTFTDMVRNDENIKSDIKINESIFTLI